MRPPKISEAQFRQVQAFTLRLEYVVQSLQADCDRILPFLSDTESESALQALAALFSGFRKCRTFVEILKSIQHNRSMHEIFQSPSVKVALTEVHHHVNRPHKRRAM